MNRILAWMRAAAVVLATGLLTAGCGGGGDPASTPMVDATGGTVTGPAGAQVVVPAGALSQPTAVAVAQSSAGAPPLPAGLAAAGPVFEFTPHGTAFAQPATVTVPFDANQVPAGAVPALYKTDAAGQWNAVPGASFNAGNATATVSSFSWFVVGLLPPQITRQPASVAVVEPAAATFTVTALGAPPFSYQWQRSGDSGASWADLPGATTSSHDTGATSVAADNGAQFRVRVSNTDGTTTSGAAVLTVTALVVAPTITTQPANQSAAAGGNASFSVMATGTGLVFQWHKDGTPISGATNASLNLNNVQATDAGSYTVVVSNLVGGAPVNSVTSAIATLTLTAPPPAGVAARIAAGNNSSSAVNATGTLYTWGTYRGAGAPNDSSSTPAPIALTNVDSVARGGSTHGIAVRDDGTVWAWGYAGDVYCNFGGTIYYAPTQVPGAAGIASASAGRSHTLLLSNAGVVSAVGCNGSGQLGQSPSIAGTSAAVAVPGLPAGITAVAAGGDFSLALDGNGEVWAWGKLTTAQGATLVDYGFTPVKLSQPSGTAAIAAGNSHALALSTAGAVLAWGSNLNGMLGDGTFTDRLTPTATLLTSGIKAVDAGGAFSLALRAADGVVLSWGINETGQLGSGGTSPGARATPAPVALLTQVEAIAAGKSGFGGNGGHALAVKSDGTVWAWGDNAQGQLGQGPGVPFAATPTVVPGLNLN